MINILKVYTVILFINLSLSANSTDSLNLSFYNFQNNGIHINENNDNILKPMIMSLLIPGLGQYIKNDKMRAGIYFGIELSGLYANNHYNNEADQEVFNYKEYSNEHWDFESWVLNYQCWDPEANICEESASDGYSHLFSNNDQYIMIWNNSHHINFYINHSEYSGLISSNDDSFINLYYLFLESGEGFMNEYNIEIIKDHHFYEGIRKYNMFFSGWDDSISDIEQLDQPSGYAVATSPHKKKYNNTWNRSIELYDYAQYAVTTLYLNHVISMLDLYFKNKFDNRFNIEIENNYQSQSVNYFLKLSIEL